jgi:hypothetical protein
LDLVVIVAARQVYTSQVFASTARYIVAIEKDGVAASHVT